MYFTTIKTVYQFSDECLSLETPTVEPSVKTRFVYIEQRAQFSKWKGWWSIAFDIIPDI